MKPFLLLSILLTVWSCADSNPEQGPDVTKEDNYIRLSGSTMGTTFNVTYKDDKHRDFESEINELLKTINDEVSTYEKQSTISKVNASDKDTVHLGVLPNDYFIQNFKKKMNNTNATQ